MGVRLLGSLVGGALAMVVFFVCLVELVAVGSCWLAAWLDWWLCLRWFSFKENVVRL